MGHRWPGRRAGRHRRVGHGGERARLPSWPPRCSSSSASCASAGRIRCGHVRRGFLLSRFLDSWPRGQPCPGRFLFPVLSTNLSRKRAFPVMHTTSRSVVAAARTHPAGIAAPSAVIVTAIILLTFVASVIVPSISPSCSGEVPRLRSSRTPASRATGSSRCTRSRPGRLYFRSCLAPSDSVPPARPASRGRIPRRCLRRPPGPRPVLACARGEPAPITRPGGRLPGMLCGPHASTRGYRSRRGGQGALQGTARILTGSVVPAVTTIVGATSGRRPGGRRADVHGDVRRAGRAGEHRPDPWPEGPGGGNGCRTVTGASQALEGTTRALTSAAGPAVQAADGLTSAVTSSTPVVLGAARSALIQTGQAATATVAATVTGASQALGAPPVTGHSVRYRGQGGRNRDVHT